MGRTRKFTYDYETRKLVRKMLEQGLSITAIAKQFGIARDTLTKHMKNDKEAKPKQQSEIRKIKLTAEQRIYVLEELTKERPIHAIAKDIGFNTSTLYNRCKEDPILKDKIKKVGHPADLTDEEKELIKKLVALMGPRIALIAASIGRSPSWLSRKIKEDEEVREILQEGLAKGFRNSSKSLHEKVQEGDINAIKYYEGTRHQVIQPTVQHVSQHVSGSLTTTNDAAERELIMSLPDEDKLRWLNGDLSLEPDAHI